MKKNMINAVHIEGLLYQHKLEKRVTGPNAKTPGVEYIQGTVDIATDDALTNIVQISYRYVTALTKKGTENTTFTTLDNIINGVYGSVMSNGADNAQMFRCDTSIGVNDFYTEREGEVVLVSAKRNEGGFIHAANALDPDESKRNKFEVDMVITGCTRKEADEERNLPEKVIIKGATFGFGNKLLPVEFSVLQPNAMTYFEDLEASSKNPVFTRLQGNEISETIVKRIEEEGAWGEMNVREVSNSRRDYVISWAKKEPYIWDDETTLLASELSELTAARNTYLAEERARYDARQAEKNGGVSFAAPTVSSKASTAEFNF